jgi:replication factor A1
VSTSIEELYQKLLDSGMSEDQLEQELERRIKEFGGFMSRQGVLFIIAKERGVNTYNDAFYKELDETIDYDEFSITISEIKEQMSNIVLVGKVVSFSGPREFVKKDSSVGKVSSLILADWSGSVKVVLWEDIAGEVTREQFREGCIIRVIGGYSKLGANNSLEVHLGKRGRIVISPQDLSNTIAIKLENVKESSLTEVPLTSRGTLKELIDSHSFIKRLQGEVHIEEFKEITKKNGDKTFLLRLLISDDSVTVPMSIWGMFAIDGLKLLEEGSTCVITCVSVKEDSYAKNKELLFTNKSSIRVI